MQDDQPTPTSKPIIFDPSIGTLRDPETGRALPKPGSKRRLSELRALRKSAPRRAKCVEEAEALGVLPPMETPSHGHGKLLRGGVPGNRASSGRAALDEELRELARTELGRMVRVMIERFDGVEPVPARCGKCDAHAVCPECGEPVWMTQPAATDAQRLAIVDAIRKIAGIEKSPIGTKKDTEPIQVTIHGAHPGHAKTQATDAIEETDGG